jgi:1,4-alpha-glucan branching enzyme
VPGGKLLFMGGEIAQEREWSHERSIDWHLLDDPAHAGIVNWVATLNGLYRTHPSLRDDPGSFRWIAADDSDQSVVVWARHAAGSDETTVWVANLTPVPRAGYRIGLPAGGQWRVAANGDDTAFGGSGHDVTRELDAEQTGCHGLPWSAAITLPPLAIMVLESGR